MDVILSADNKFAAVQLFQFVPYTYQPVTAVHYFTNDAAAAVATFLTKKSIELKCLMPNGVHVDGELSFIRRSFLR